MPFLLTLLGTDTDFSPAERDQGIQVSETLSFISTCVQPVATKGATAELATSGATAELVTEATAEEKTEAVHGEFPQLTAPYRSDMRGVTVIEGPVTSGRNVYEKIARGIYEILDAIHHGERQINLIGHSRGAVECIVVAHEFQRIHDSLRSSAGGGSREQLIDMFCDSPCNETKKQLKLLLDPLKSSDTSLTELCSALGCVDKDAVRLSLFALDPVPGVEHETVAGSLGWAWKDKRHYVIPPIVKEYRQIVLENEPSIGFRGIVPRAEAPNKTQYKLLNMPGHHGTASGNPLDQQHSAKFIQHADKTRDCQIITMTLLYDFLCKNGMAFKPAAEDMFLTSYFNDYHGATIAEKYVYKRKHYDLMSRNRAYYEAFNGTSYASGLEDIGTRMLGGAVNGERKLYYHDHLDTVTRLGSIIPFKKEGIINEEHAMLYIGLFLDLDLATMADSPEIYLNVFIENCVGSDSDFVTRYTSLTEGIKENVRDGVKSLVISLAEIYLRNNLSAERKAVLLTVLGKMSRLHDIHDGSDAGRLFKALYNRILTDMDQWIDAQVRSQFADLSDLVFALETLHDGEPPADMYQIAFNKHEQFLRAAENLAAIQACFTYPDPALADKFTKQIQKLRFYAEGVELFCAKAMLSTDRTVPTSFDDSQEANFAEKVTSLMQGLSGSLRRQNVELEQSLSQANLLTAGMCEQICNSARAFQQTLDNNADLLQKIVTLTSDIAVLKEENQTLAQKLGQARDQLSVHETTICSFQSNKDRLMAELADLSQQLSSNAVDSHALMEQYSRLNHQYDQVNEELDRLNQRHSALEGANARLRTTVQAGCSTPEGAFTGISLQIVSGFALVMGITAVAVALTVLFLYGSTYFVPTAVMLGVGMAASAVGLFGFREGAQRQVKENLIAAMPVQSV